MLPYVITILAAYLLGTLNPALFLSRRRGVDLRAGGSKNLGTANTVILMGWGMGFLVCLFDVGKAALSVLLSQRVFPGTPYLGLIAGVACILGHMFPFYLRFRGGKGFASYVGVMLAVNWRFTLSFAAFAILMAVLTRVIFAATLVTIVSFPVFLAVTAFWVDAAIIGFASLVILCRHKENFTRILNGTEVRFKQARKGELRVKK